MSYYSILGLEKEPFSTSPDPSFFYRSKEHRTALYKIEIAIRLKRGLSLILGDIGIGKTTLSRTLVQSYRKEPAFITHIIMDPGYSTEYQFYTAVAKTFGLSIKATASVIYKEAIEEYLFHKGVTEGKTIVLLIDEGQKMSSASLEALRTLLNYETNDYKLLQLVIFGQMELLPKVRRIPNFMDRISLKHTISPLDEEETLEIIDFRLRQAGYTSNDPLFSDDAIRSVYAFSRGYPRKIAMLCHYALETIVMEGLPFVDNNVMCKIIEKEVQYNGQGLFSGREIAKSNQRGRQNYYITA